jgi:hypothetical protein
MQFFILRFDNADVLLAQAGPPGWLAWGVSL